MDRNSSEHGNCTRRRYLEGSAGAIALFGGCSALSPTAVPTNDGPENETTTDSTSARTATDSSGTASTADSDRPTAITTVDPPVVNLPTEFVQTDGSQFVLNGDPYVVAGTSNSRLLQPWTRRALVDEIVEEAAAMGMNSLRIWAFGNGVLSEGTNESRYLQPRPGVYGEKAFQRFDYIVEKAKRHGLRLIPALVNNWDVFGSMKQYVRWSETAGSYEESESGRGMLHDAFYTDEGSRRLYRDYVRQVLTRENSISGVEYREDPTILMWELANEPRVDVEGTDRLQAWIESMGEYVKAIDSNHLLSTGSEGFYAEGDDNWMYNGDTGIDYIENHRADTVDACSFHCWPDHWSISVSESVEWIQRHVREAHDELGVPAYLGEYGWPVDRTNSASETSRQRAKRNRIFERWHSTLQASNCNGAAVWQHRGHNYTTSADSPPLTGIDGKNADPYAFYHPEDEATIQRLEQYARASTDS